MDGWVGGWVEGRKEAKAGLRIAYSNQKYAKLKRCRGVWVRGELLIHNFLFMLTLQ